MKDIETHLLRLLDGTIQLVFIGAIFAVIVGCLVVVSSYTGIPILVIIIVVVILLPIAYTVGYISEKS